MLQNEISQVFEPSNEENSSKQPTKNHAPKQQEQNENRQNGTSIAEWEAAQVFSVIAADLNEMITRYKLSNSLNENNFTHKINNDTYQIITDRMNENVPINGSLTNTKETNGIHISDDVLIKELSASQSTLNSTVRPNNISKCICNLNLIPDIQCRNLLFIYPLIRYTAIY